MALTCPECLEHQFSDDTRGRTRCPACKSHLIISSDLITGKVTIRELVTQRVKKVEVKSPTKVGETFSFVTEGPAAPVETKCVGCGKTVNPLFSYYGKVVARTAFYTRRVVGEELGNSNIRVGETVRVGFPLSRKGFICDACAALPSTQTDPLPGSICRGAIKAKGRVVRDGDPLLLPSVERDWEFESEIKSADRSSSTTHRPQADLVPLRNEYDNQWLNVGRRKK